MNQITPIRTFTSGQDVLYVQLAREIAIDHFPLGEILDRHKISNEDWLAISQSPRFQSLLTSEISNWQSAVNTHERTKLKAAAIMELYLEEANVRLFDAKENLPAKVELAKLIARIAGMGTTTAINGEGGGGEKFSITINLGEDKKLSFEKHLQPKLIESNVNDQ